MRRCAHGGLSRSLKTDYLDEDTNHSFDVESLSEEHSHSDKRPGFGEVDFNFLGLTIPNDDRSVHVKRMDTYCDRREQSLVGHCLNSDWRADCFKKSGSYADQLAESGSR